MPTRTGAFGGKKSAKTKFTKTQLRKGEDTSKKKKKVSKKKK